MATNKEREAELKKRGVTVPKKANTATLEKLLAESEPKQTDTTPADPTDDDAPPLVGSDDDTDSDADGADLIEDLTEAPQAETTGNPNPAPTVYDPLPRVTEPLTGETLPVARKTESGVWCPFCDHASFPNIDQCVKCGATFDEDRTEAQR